MRLSPAASTCLRHRFMQCTAQPAPCSLNHTSSNSALVERMKVVLKVMADRATANYDLVRLCSAHRLASCQLMLRGMTYVREPSPIVLLR
ncbi:hypothetical protein IG631_18019 [Alternaria alternata]|nr:hypothetical protein IG631_18019 [Alternaria alternata]